MKKSLAFTLAEVLITLTVIGVVAALTIPSVIVKTNQQEYRTGFKKAVTVLNQAITMNMAKDDESPKDMENDGDLFDYLKRRMNVINIDTSATNSAFYTADGFRYEVTDNNTECAYSNPCFVMVDVNGDKGPHDVNNGITNSELSDLAQRERVSDMFPIMIIESGAVPYGEVAQKALYKGVD